MILAIDPGRTFGWAQFDPATGWLVACGATPDFEKIPIPATQLAIETPHGGKQKASRTDLVKLARRMQEAIVHVRAPVTYEYQPNHWRGGSVEKKIMAWRILNRWTYPLEAVLIGKNHNTIDAVGIGIFHCALIGLRPVLCVR